MPTWTRAALTQLGWVGPIPAGVDPTVVTVLARWMGSRRSRYKNPPAYLRAILGGVDGGRGLADSLGLIVGALSSDPAAQETPGAAQETMSVNGATAPMPYPEWVEKEIADSNWGDAVRVEAARRAAQAEMRLSMLWVLTVAAEWDNRGSQQTTVPF